MTRILAGSLYAAVTVVLAAVAAWPIYRSAAFVLLVISATLLAAALATLVFWRRLSPGATAGLLAAVILVVGVPVAVPGRATDPASFARALGDLAAGLVVGWKDLLTVDLPVGSYQNLLVPALVVFLVGTTVMLLCAWRSDRGEFAAVPVAIAMVGFGLLFGRSDVSAPLTIGPVSLSAPVETAVGIAALTAGVLWLSWRSREERVRAVRAAAPRGARLRVRRVGARGGRRAALGLGMVAVSAMCALAVSGIAAAAPRTVLREATGPHVEISSAVSPLVAYRALFRDARVDDVVFTVAGPRIPERIRLAVLDDYDGTEFRTAADRGSAFTRVASARAPEQGERVAVDVSIGAWDAIWMPMTGSLASVTFSGPRAAQLSDAFYVDDELSAAVQVAGWQSGDGYHLDAAVAAVPSLADADPAGVRAGTELTVETPASLRAWMRAHLEGTGGAALDGLVSLLRERGFLSHALTDSESEWMPIAGVDTLVPSAAGHSLARIDQLFDALLEREQSPSAEASGNLVAAIGDDEQFAVAVWLMARELGFESRVVVGARTSSADPALPVCTAGVCRAADIAAWVEVHSAAGAWIPVDVTPQHAQVPTREVTAQPDPTIGTDVRPDTVDEVEPPKPAQEDTPANTEHIEEADLSWLWATLWVAGGVLGLVIVVTGPFLAVVVVKAWRRRARRTAADPVDRIAGGWQEYLDVSVDARRQPPVAATRVEVADAWGGGVAGELARGADEAVFSGRPVTDDQASAFWRVVDAERARLPVGLWRRLRAAVSLKSFVRGRSLRRSPSHTERSHPERGNRVRIDTRDAPHEYTRR